LFVLFIFHILLAGGTTARRCALSTELFTLTVDIVHVAFLLFTVESSNPGPATVRFGTLNARSAGYRTASIEDLIRDNKLDILTACESWIVDYAPDAIKKDVAPFNYSVLHTRRSRAADRSRTGGALALIHINEIIVRRK